MDTAQNMTGGRELVMVSNRLPVDRDVAPDGTLTWRPSPGGLVTAVEPIVAQLGCLWVGWAGAADERIDAFSVGPMRLLPVELSADDIELYYEGLSNATLWPLYHDVIAQPEFHREWWLRYRRVNQRFADRVAREAAEGAIVWVHDYQLQLVPAMLREVRPDLTIAFFLHIPFPGERLFAQLPWRKRIIDGLLGADVIGFQHAADAAAFRSVVERFARTPALGNTIVLPPGPSDERTAEGAGASSASPEGVPLSARRTVIAQEFPISIDAAAFEEIANRPDVRRRAQEIRSELGDPRTVMLGVDRLDYTKGIRHRLKAYDELLADGELDAADTVLVQVASPSRERVEAYRQLRDEVESTVGRINGDHGSIGSTPLVYLHRGHSREEMVALYLAADVLLVTPLRDGMNLVAKEYVACRPDERGVLVLSEFAGAAAELDAALLVNPHDIEGLKAAILRGVRMSEQEQERRMRALRRRVTEHDVHHWAAGFLGAVRATAERRAVAPSAAVRESQQMSTALLPRSIEERIRRLATLPELIVATDFDGTVAPLVSRPQDARILPRAQEALAALAGAPGISVVLLTGRSLAGLAETGVQSEGWIVSGSHGAELAGNAVEVVIPSEEPISDDERARLEKLERRFERAFEGEPGVRLEQKPFGIAVHARQVTDAEVAQGALDAAEVLGAAAGMRLRTGKLVREFSVRASNKGDVLQRIRSSLDGVPVLFLGDDVTDEDVYAVLGSDDLGIKVGEGKSAAAERVGDPATAAAVLALLADLRTGI